MDKLFSFMSLFQQFPDEQVSFFKCDYSFFIFLQPWIWFEIAAKYSTYPPYT